MNTRLNGLTQSLKRYRRYRETLGELHNLGDRELLDLGLNRSDFRKIAHSAAYDG